MPRKYWFFSFLTNCCRLGVHMAFSFVIALFKMVLKSDWENMMYRCTMGVRISNTRSHIMYLFARSRFGYTSIKSPYYAWQNFSVCEWSEVKMSGIYHALSWSQDSYWLKTYKYINTTNKCKKMAHKYEGIKC